MGDVIDLEERRSGRVPDIDRLERALSMVEEAAEAAGLRVAPAWLRRGLRSAQAALRSGNVRAAAERAEQMALRLGGDSRAG